MTDERQYSHWVGDGCPGGHQERIAFIVPGLAPASYSGNSRVHWAKRHREGAHYGLTVQILAQAAKPVRNGPVWPYAHVTVLQRACRLRDVDNFAASFKPGLDGIVKAGIIADDGPDHVQVTYVAERVRHRGDQCVVVSIERLDEHEWCHPEFHRCDGGGPGEYARYISAEPVR